jgi:hypothetical protein
MGATTAIALSLYSTVQGFQSSQRQARAASTQGSYTAAIDEQNAALADAQAQDAIARGSVDEGRQRLATRQNIGATRAAQAASGVDISSGSAADVQASEAGLGELDALTIRNNAAREAWGYNVDAGNLRQQAKLARFTGQEAAAGYRAQSYSQLITGGLNTYGIYQQNRNAKQDLRGSENRPGGGR